MNISNLGERLNPRALLHGLLLIFFFAATGCAFNGQGQRKPNYDGPGALPPLAYYQLLSRLTPAELNRERTVLAALPQTPNTQIRTAMLFGTPRGPLDLAKAVQQLDLILKSNDPAAVSLHPLARLLADNYTERQKAEGLLDRQGQQMKESQRKVIELQEKLDGLADIERTLPERPRSSRMINSRGAR